MDSGLQEAVAPAPGPLHKFARNNQHLAFITQQLAPLAAVVGGRPWGIGFSDACLPTSDVPVVLMNGQDDQNQLLAEAYWEVLVPLDSHRFLLLPAPGSQSDPRTRSDHRIKPDAGLGILVWELLWGAADKHVFWHPDHVPYAVETSDRERGPRLPRPWAGGTREPPQMMLQYEALPTGLTVERRWLEKHPSGRTSTPAQLPRRPAVLRRFREVLGGRDGGRWDAINPTRRWAAAVPPAPQARRLRCASRARSPSYLGAGLDAAGIDALLPTPGSENRRATSFKWPLAARITAFSTRSLDVPNVPGESVYDRRSQSASADHRSRRRLMTCLTLRYDVAVRAIPPRRRCLQHGK